MERLVALTQSIARTNNEARIGRTEEVLVEGNSRTDDAFLRGRTRRNTTVNFTGDAHPGALVDVVIDAATSTTLRGAQTVPSHGLVTLGACAS
jgi:tRNA-2-methylthio-N6-dimethylallyladenosine synthase